MPQHKRTCQDCDSTFFSSYGRSIQCLPCWKTDQGYTLSKADNALIVTQEKYTELDNAQPANSASDSDPKELARLKQKVRNMQSEKDALALQVKVLHAQVAQLRATQGASSSYGSGLSRGFIKKLLMLCHPDKHDNSDLATEVTKELLSRR